MKYYLRTINIIIGLALSFSLFCCSQGSDKKTPTKAGGGRK